MTNPLWLLLLLPLLPLLNPKFRTFVDEELKEYALRMGDWARALWFWPGALWHAHHYKARHRNGLLAPFRWSS